MYCRNGHYIGLVNPVLRARSSGQLRRMIERASQDESQERLPAFCATCGSSNISNCQHCQAPIEIRHVRSRPGFCGHCGNPFPWTEKVLSAAKEYIDELDLSPDDLSPEEKTKQKGNLDELTKNTDLTPLAASSFKKFMNKIGPAAGLLREIIVPILTAEVKKVLGL